MSSGGRLVGMGQRNGGFGVLWDGALGVVGWLQPHWQRSGRQFPLGRRGLVWRWVSLMAPQPLLVMSALEEDVEHRIPAPVSISGGDGGHPCSPSWRLRDSRLHLELVLPHTKQRGFSQHTSTSPPPPGWVQHPSCARGCRGATAHGWRQRTGRMQPRRCCDSAPEHLPPAGTECSRGMLSRRRGTSGVPRNGISSQQSPGAW